MNQELGFETIPFEIAPQFHSEVYEEESEFGRRRPSAGVASRRSRPSPSPGRSMKGNKRPQMPRPRPIPRGRQRPWPVIRGPYSLVNEPYAVEPEPSDSERVRWVQDCLNQTLGLQLPVTGIMGTETRSAVRSFQKQQGLRASGIIELDTEEALKAACGGQSAGTRDAGNSRDEEELGPLTATVNWLVNDKSTSSPSKYLFSISKAAEKKGVGGVYILTGHLKADPQMRNRILKVGSTIDFGSRFGKTGYGRKEFTNVYGNVLAYLGRVEGAKSPAEQIERAIARLFYRAGEELPADQKPPEQGPVTGRVEIRNIVPPVFEGQLRQAYRASGTEMRKTKSGGRRPIATRRSGIPLPSSPGLLALDAFPQWEVNQKRDSSRRGGAFQVNDAVMHSNNCTCPTCQMARELVWGEAELQGLGEVYDEMDLESPYSEAEEIELAAELLSISSEEELDQFLGKLIKGAWKGIKKVGSFVGKIAKPLGGVLKGVAKAALPFVGGALGSFIPIPGVGTALGSALGGALSKALELEFGELAEEEQELEMARRFVRIAGTAAMRAAKADPYADPEQEIQSAIMTAARQQVPNLPDIPGTGPALQGMTRQQRWVRHGNRIVVLGA
jgi:peptidoglycan hydrolase-like protein with peptidoglycan-binding domain